MGTEQLERAFGVTRGLLANVKPDQYDDPTPCASWDVRRLISHIVGGSHWFAASVNAGASPENDTSEDTDYTQGDLMASYDEGIKASLDAFGADGAAEKIVKLPFGEFPGGIFQLIATNDVFTHGWDLARATGQSTDLDPELAGELLASAKMMLSSDDFRGPDGSGLPFGPIVDVPEDAPVADQLAGFLGRAV